MRTNTKNLFTVLIADHNSAFRAAASRFVASLPGFAVLNRQVGPDDVIAEYVLHRPDIVIAPIGDNYTMGAREAAVAIDRWLKPKLAIPCHYMTFPVLAQSADDFKAAVKGCEVWAPAPMGRREL